MKWRELLIVSIALMGISYGLSLKCTIEMQDGVYAACINKTYHTLFSDEDVYCGCSKEVESTWWHIDQCDAVVINPNNVIRSDEGDIVANYWSNDGNGKVSACKNNNGYICDVNPNDGATADMSLTSVGYCDASEETCVRCDEGKEAKRFDGSWTAINHDGNGLCESGCPGTADICDELEAGTWSSRQIGTTPFEAFCNSTCQVSDTRCNAAFGADQNCNGLDPGDVCHTDFCDSHNRLNDYNGNHALDNVSCDSSCGCDNTIDSALCDTECGASEECDNEEIGYNIGNAGCDDECAWHFCGLYRWNNDTNLCFSSCSSNSQCWNNSVCDLVGSGMNSCVIDEESPSVSIINPANNSKFNSNPVPYSIIATDNADPVLDCKYELDGANASIGTANEGETKSGNLQDIDAQGWHKIRFICRDEAGNEGFSDYNDFLYDSIAPSYSNYHYTDITPTVDNSLIDGDMIIISSDWYDKYGIVKSELYSNKSGSMQFEDSINYPSRPSSATTNYVFNTSGYGDKTIAFIIKAYDWAGNSNETYKLLVHIYKPTTTINVTLREIGGYAPRRLEFEGDAKENLNWVANDSGRTLLAGDFMIRHTGIGTTIDNLFALSANLPHGIKAKLSGTSDSSDAEYLSTSFQKLSFCTHMIPNDTCEVWFWLELPEATPPTQEPEAFNISIKSESI